MPKISRRNFIRLGAAALVAGVLPESKQLIETCGRCKKPIDTETAEMCWYCEEWLCYECWEEYAHCGHPEAEVQNEQAQAMFEQLEKRQRAMLEFTEKVLKGGGDVWPTLPAFTSKDCERAGQAMMDGFMQGIKATLSAEDIEKLARVRDAFGGENA